MRTKLKFIQIVICITLISGLVLSCTRTPTRPSLAIDFQNFVNNQNHHTQLRNFERRLRVSGVYNVIPTWQLLRQGTDWQRNNLPQFAFPPVYLWPRMTNTLKFMRRFILPVIGPVDVVSGFRTPTYNFAAGGAPRSQHLEFSALDVVPRSTISRSELHGRLLNIWQIHGKGLDMGLGLYQGKRFHIDTGGHRKWHR